MKSITGFSTVMNFERDGIPAHVLFKRLAIFFDEVIFNPRYCPIGRDDFFKTHTDYLGMLVSDNIESGRALAKTKGFKSVFINCWDYIEDVERFETGLENILEKELMNKIFSYAYEKEMPEGAIIHTKEFKQLCGDMWRDLQLYSGFKEIEPNIAGNLSSHFGEAFTDFSRSEGRLINELSLNSTQIPDFSELSWDQIFELRKDRSIQKFREKISDNFDKLHGIDSEIISGLWDVASYARPNIKGTSLKCILSNLPSPTIINPVGLGTAIKDTYDEYKLEESKGWLFFIQKARALAEASPNKKINKDT